MSLRERKNGTLKGVKAEKYDHDRDRWDETKDFVGFVIGDDAFLIAHKELQDGYELEIEISEKALRNMLDAIAEQRELLRNKKESFSEDPYPDRFTWLEGDFPT